MATVPETLKDQSTRKPDKRPACETHRSYELAGGLLLVLVIFGIFALVAWLFNMLPESTESCNFLYMMRP